MSFVVYYTFITLEWFDGRAGSHPSMFTLKMIPVPWKKATDVL